MAVNEEMPLPGKVVSADNWCAGSSRPVLPLL